MKILALTGRLGLSETALMREMQFRLGDNFQIREYPFADAGEPVSLAPLANEIKPDVIWITDLDRRPWWTDHCPVPVVASFLEPMRGLNAWAPEMAPVFARMFVCAWACEKEFVTDTPCRLERWDPHWFGSAQESRVYSPSGTRREIDVAFVGQMEGQEFSLRTAFYKAVAGRIKPHTYNFAMAPPKAIYPMAKIALIVSGMPKDDLEFIPEQAIHAAGCGSLVVSQRMPEYADWQGPQFAPGDVDGAANAILEALKAGTSERARPQWFQVHHSMCAEHAADRVLRVLEDAITDYKPISDDRRLYCMARAIVAMATEPEGWPLVHVERYLIQPLGKAHEIFSSIKEEEIESRCQFLARLTAMALGIESSSKLREAVSEAAKDSIASHMASVCDVILSASRMQLFIPRTNVSDRHLEFLGRLLSLFGGLGIKDRQR